MRRDDEAMLGLSEVLTSATSHAEAARLTLVSVPAADVTCGASELRAGEGGWVRPARIDALQERALQSCLAWHPGLYRQMARTTAGVCLRLATDGTEVALAVRLDEEPRGTTEVLAPLDEEMRRPHDGISAVVDGRPVGCSMPQALVRSLPWMEETQGMGLFTVRLERREGRGAGTMAIPGLGTRHEVCLWLPCLRGCEVRELWSDGTYIEPLPARGRMLVLGDSVGQGFCADDPLLAWPTLLAEHLGLELCNQSIGGQVFQPSAVMAPAIEGVELVLVELGNNYRHEACSAAVATRDARAHLHEAARLYANARKVAITPTGYDALACPVHPGSCAREVPAVVRVAARRWGYQIVDGTLLIDKDDPMLVDGEHPGPAGHAQMAARLATLLA